ncbi:MAG: SMI1/KNR4 family protein [Bacteroidetes bacterium]|nr:SMI1/KNR4 family protein [Bacteroidota bacterium]
MKRPEAKVEEDTRHSRAPGGGDNQINMVDLQQIYQLSELTVLDIQKFDKVIPFGKDCMGNEFFFTISNLIMGNNAKIYLFDKDLDEVEQVAPSFKELVCAYLNLPLGPK